MTTPEYPIYDFLTASKVERPLSAALKVWLGKFSEMFVERWREFAPTDISVVPLLNNVLTFEAAQAKWNRPSIGVPISIRDNAVQGMIVAKRTDLLILIMEILSETLTEKPADRELTSIEISLSQLLFQQSVATFGEAWPAKEVMPIKVGELDLLPNRCRLFTPQREVLITGTEIRTSCGSDAGPARIEWLFAKDELQKLLGIDPAAPLPKSGEKIQADNIAQIKIDIAARLGSAELQMEDLLKLTEGDIVKLNQPIERPLTLLVNQHPTFLAWPGRSGDQQCFQIDTVI